MRKTFIVLHGITAALGFALIILLAQPAPGSHPPPVVFIPFVVAAWLLLHAIFALLQWLERVGRKRGARAWPRAMIVSALFYLASAAIYSLASVDAVSRAKAWRLELLIPIGAATYCYATLLSILLRHKAGRYLASLGFLATGIFGMVAFVLSLASHSPFDGQSIFNGLLSVLLIGVGFAVFHQLEDK